MDDVLHLDDAVPGDLVPSEDARDARVHRAEPEVGRLEARLDGRAVTVQVVRGVRRHHRADASHAPRLRADTSPGLRGVERATDVAGEAHVRHPAPGAPVEVARDGVDVSVVREVGHRDVQRVRVDAAGHPSGVAIHVVADELEEEILRATGPGQVERVAVAVARVHAAVIHPDDLGTPVDDGEGVHAPDLVREGVDGDVVGDHAVASRGRPGDLADRAVEEDHQVAPDGSEAAPRLPQVVVRVGIPLQQVRVRVTEAQVLVRVETDQPVQPHREVYDAGPALRRPVEAVYLVVCRAGVRAIRGGEEETVTDEDPVLPRGAVHVVLGRVAVVVHLLVPRREVLRGGCVPDGSVLVDGPHEVAAVERVVRHRAHVARDGRCRRALEDGALVLPAPTLAQGDAQATDDPVLGVPQGVRLR